MNEDGFIVDDFNIAIHAAEVAEIKTEDVVDKSTDE